MRFFTGIALCAIMVLGFSADAEAAKGKKKKNAAHTIKGTVVSVQTDKGSKGLGAITLKTHGKKGKAGKEVKVTIGKDTKIEKVAGKKAGKKTQTASFSALHTGEHVVVQAGPSNHAQHISIAAKKKKKAAAG